MLTAVADHFKVVHATPRLGTPGYGNLPREDTTRLKFLASHTSENFKGLELMGFGLALP